MAGTNTSTSTIVEQKPTMNSLPMAKVDSVMNEDGVTLASSKPTSEATIKPISSNSTEVRVLKVHEYKQAALSLAHAFKDDDTARYFLDTPERKDWSAEQKWDLHVKIMEYITYAHLLNGLVLSAGPNYECVALW